MPPAIEFPGAASGPFERAGYDKTSHNQSTPDRPFLIQLRQEEKRADGTFRPAASLQLAAAFRSSGLLFLLPPEDLKSLLFLLTFLSPNGECQAALHQLAGAMRVSAFKAQRRMKRLLDFVWNNQSLVLNHRRESGLVFYRPNPHLIAYESLTAPKPEPYTAPIVAGSRDAVIAHSRRTYGRPRAEVEHDMAVRMGWDKVQQEMEDKATQMSDEVETLSFHAREVLQRLTSVGLTIEQALDLLRAFESVRIERQLQWLPYRQAKNPAGFLLAAVKDDYEAPPPLRHGAAPGHNAELRRVESPPEDVTMTEQAHVFSAPTAKELQDGPLIVPPPISSLPADGPSSEALFDGEPDQP